MRSFHSLLRRLQSFLRKDAGNVDLSEELLFHVERQTEENPPHLTRRTRTACSRLAAWAGCGNDIHAAVGRLSL